MCQKIITAKRSVLLLIIVVLLSSIGFWFYSGLDQDHSDSLPSGVNSVDFDEGQNSTTRIGENTPPNRPPIVNFQEKNETIYVEGVLTYGSSTCNNISIKDIRYDKKSGMLNLDIGWTKEEDDSGGFTSSCTDDLASKPYSVSIQFESKVPSVVEITEFHYEPVKNDNTRTVSTRVKNSDLRNSTRE
ncbi:hypothetical protein ACOZ4N_00805 (plasmid) [Halorientalis pallida]|uniref:hypothetical protein n=1 Tax=Halorientalis pallida TaxID=2479928 RepID=UPI003C704C76